MIKGVIFDLDNTLYDENCYFFEVFSIFCDKYKLDLNKIKSIFTDEFKLKSSDYFGDILKKISFYSLQKQNEMFEIYQNINCYLSLYKNALELLNFLQQKAIKTAIITNGDIKAQQNKIKLLNLQNKIKHIVYAREFGKECEKPNSVSFLKALEMLNLKASEVIFVGDNPKTDIVGAKNTSIKAYRFLNGYTKNIECNDCKNIKNLLELKELIR